jgi:GxxExxY protein
LGFVKGRFQLLPFTSPKADSFLIRKRKEWILMHKKELSKKVIEAAITVYRDLGCGFLEAAYQKALMITLHEMGLNAEKEKKLELYYHGQVIGEYYLDILVEDTIILELKAVKEIMPKFQAQTVNYLKCSEYKVAYLINFGKETFQFERFVDFSG